MAENSLRPTKKQKELLMFIDEFISKHGYSPSYREIMTGLNYTSVATVALHVNSLITRGHLRKRENSARSLEVVKQGDSAKVTTNQVAASEEKWLVEKVEHAFQEAESLGELTEIQVSNLTTLIEALRILGVEGAALGFTPRLTLLKKQQSPVASV